MILAALDAKAWKMITGTWTSVARTDDDAEEYRDLVVLTLHRCSTPWRAGPCWRVEKALREQGIEYEIVRGPLRPSQRVDLERLSGQRFYPVIEFEDGTVFRDESKNMAAAISAGRLDERRARRLSRPPAGCEASAADPATGTLKPADQ